jgi:GxxExxY protein
MMKEDFQHKELTAKILEAAFTVHNTLGAGFLEKVYENALAVEFQNRGIPFQQQAPFGVKYNGILVGEYAADFVVGGAVVPELKATQAIDSSHDAQLLNYLRATGLQVGLLLNFSRPKLEYKRMVLTTK